MNLPHFRKSPDPSKTLDELLNEVCRIVREECYDEYQERSIVPPNIVAARSFEELAARGLHGEENVRALWIHLANGDHALIEERVLLYREVWHSGWRVGCRAGHNATMESLETT